MGSGAGPGSVGVSRKRAEDWPMPENDRLELAASAASVVDRGLGKPG